MPNTIEIVLEREDLYESKQKRRIAFQHGYKILEDAMVVNKLLGN